MGVELLSFEGCPHAAQVEERLRSALAEVGRDPDAVEHVIVEGHEEAESLGFIGSPTIRVDGVDPFARGDEPAAFACRVYQTPDGESGSPTVEQLVEALA